MCSRTAGVMTTLMRNGREERSPTARAADAHRLYQDLGFAGLPEGSDAAVRIYHCSACHHEMRLTVWATVT